MDIDYNLKKVSMWLSGGRSIQVERKVLSKSPRQECTRCMYEKNCKKISVASAKCAWGKEVGIE